jgi:hypothetical protein
MEFEINFSYGNGQGKCAICHENINKDAVQYVVHVSTHSARVHVNCLNKKLKKEHEKLMEDK